jgi:hypothetical protein
MAAAILTFGLSFSSCAVEDLPVDPATLPNPDEWEIDFLALSEKYADKVGLTISEAVVDNVGTTSIVNGALKEPAEDGSETATEELDSRFGVQTGTNWFFYTNKGKTGLYQGNGGGRTFGVFDVKKDQIITVEVTEQPSIKIGADNLELLSTVDGVYVYYAKEDCDVVFNLARYNVITKISVKYIVNAAFYTVKFVNEAGQKVKDDATHKGYVGLPISLLPSDMDPIDIENGRLIFKEADNTESNVVKKDGSTVVTVVYREADKSYAVLNCMAGSTLLYRFNDANKYWFYEGASLTIYPSRCYGKDGVYYTTPATTWNGTSFTFPGSVTPTVSGGKTYYIGTQNYEVDESIVYFANFEDLALPTVDAGDGVGLGQLSGTVNNWYNWTNAPWERLDGGRGIRLDKDAYVWTEPIAVAGTYNVAIYGRNDGGSEAATPFVLGLRDAEGNITWLEDLAAPAWAGGNTGEKVLENVTIPAGSSLVVKNPDEANLITLDDIKVTKPAAAE